MIDQRCVVTLRVCIGLICVSLAAGSCSIYPKLTSVPPLDDGLEGLAGKIAYAYHGTLLDEELNELPTDEGSLRQIQGSMISNMLGDLSAQKRERFESLVERVNSTEDWNSTELIILNDALIGRLLSAVSKTTALRYRWRYLVINEKLFEAIDFDPDFVGPGTRLGGVMREFAIFDDFRVPPTDGVTYRSRCRSQRVPIPPDWPSSDWEFQGIQDSRFVFASNPTYITEVWAYKDANGTCMALPRIDPKNIANPDDDEVKLLGIICQGKMSGRACFWDNIDSATNVRITGNNPQLQISKLKNGSNLGENCVNCHRGKNVFLIHPDTAIDVSGTFETDPDVRYTPISGQTGWQNPTPLFSHGEGMCATCHEVPQLTNQYCGILKQALEKTMPSQAKPAGISNPLSSFETHVNAFKSACPGF